MNQEQKYSRFALCREMLETTGVVRQFKLKEIGPVLESLKTTDRLFLTGEGSSRIFPAKNLITTAYKKGLRLELATEGGRQAQEYNLNGWTIFAASNSGQTKEVIALFDQLKNKGHSGRFGLTANHNTKLEYMSDRTYVLSCGKEDAVAATKSVVEQALFYAALLGEFCGDKLDAKMGPLADAVEKALTTPIDPAMVQAVAKAGTICFSGRNDGVAEELTLKTNEITRKKSDYFEGTYAVHGVEEVLNNTDAVILINPFKAELEKIKTTLADGVGMKVFVIATEPTIFPTLVVPDMGDLTPFIMLTAGWNLLVEVGLALDINLDKPVRARKIGNEFTGS
ncbi:MAG: sugar isomerase [Elusimicrobia bacterium RIFOXYB2_FULL_49_7]|nr:MAG: sugar isomerase [Elusimicrobia bacterium RIFOXYB2_FULL_49_7]